MGFEVENGYERYNSSRTFRGDKTQGEAAEQRVMTQLRRYGVQCVQSPKGQAVGWDLQMVHHAHGALERIEVKDDTAAQKTGNFFVEVCRIPCSYDVGKQVFTTSSWGSEAKVVASGVYAHDPLQPLTYVCFLVGTEMIWIHRGHLLKLIRENGKKYKHVKNPEGRAFALLIPVKDVKSLSVSIEAVVSPYVKKNMGGRAEN